MGKFFTAETERHEGPLQGVKIVEMGTVVMVPYAAQILGDLGADVIKIEAPKGDLSRAFPGGRSEGLGPLYMAANKSKRNMVLNLKDAADRATFIELLQEADAFVTNQRPQALEKLKVDYDSLKDQIPDLVYCSAQGFRKGSKQFHNAAYDEIVQSAGGMTSTMKYLTGQPSCMPSILADKISGLVIINSILSALFYKQKTGKGQEVNVPMVDTLFGFMIMEHLAGNMFIPPTKEGGGYPLSLFPGHGDVEAKDGMVSIHLYSHQNVLDFLKAAGREDLLDTDPYLSDWSNTYTDSRKHLYDVVAQVAPALTVDEWIEVGNKHSIPMSIPVDIKNPLANEYVREGKLLKEVQHPTEGPILVSSYPIYYGQSPVGEYGFAQPFPGALHK